jgi:hypothetical protein
MWLPSIPRKKGVGAASFIVYGEEIIISLLLLIVYG